MRILAMSDAHGRTTPAEDAIERTKPNIVIYLGDGSKQIEDMSDYYPDISFYIVRGNCDFTNHPDSGEIMVMGKRIFFTHGHIYHVKYGYDELIGAARSRKADLVLFGHTHSAYNQYDNGLYIMNPGSLSSPAEGRPSYGVIDVTAAGIVTNIMNI